MNIGGNTGGERRDIQYQLVIFRGLYKSEHVEEEEILNLLEAVELPELSAEHIALMEAPILSKEVEWAIQYTCFESKHCTQTRLLQNSTKSSAMN